MTRLWTAASVLFVAAAASSPHPPQMPPADLPPGGRGVYTNEGSFDVGTGESSIMYWPPTKRMIVFESIFCGYWGHAGNFPGTPFADAAVNHSYFRVRDLDNGTVLANISGSIRYGFGSAFVDHTGPTATAWVFGTPNDRCHEHEHDEWNCLGPPPYGNHCGVYAWSSTDLTTWSGPVKTDVGCCASPWGWANTAVATVSSTSALSRPPSLSSTSSQRHMTSSSRSETTRRSRLPPHKFVMMLDGGTIALSDGTPSHGWVVINSTLPWTDGGAPELPGVAPSIRHFDGFYYTTTGGHNIFLYRTKDFVHWDLAPRSPLIAPSLHDAKVAPFASFGRNLATNPWHSAVLASARDGLAHPEDWDWNSNDSDMCCDHPDITTAYFNWGDSSQGQSAANYSGPGCFQAIARANTTLAVLLSAQFDD